MKVPVRCSEAVCNSQKRRVTGVGRKSPRIKFGVVKKGTTREASAATQKYARRTRVCGRGWDRNVCCMMYDGNRIRRSGSPG